MPAIEGVKGSHFFPNVMRMVIGHGIADSGHHLADGLPVGLSGYRFDGLAHPLHAALGIGKGAIAFGKAGRRQNHVSELGGLSQEQLLYHQEFQVVQGFLDMIGIGIQSKPGFRPVYTSL